MTFIRTRARLIAAAALVAVSGTALCYNLDLAPAGQAPGQDPKGAPAVPKGPAKAAADRWQDGFDRDVKRLARSVPVSEGPCKVTSEIQQVGDGADVMKISSEIESRLLLNPNVATIYPGCIVTHDGIKSGLLTPVLPDGSQRGPLKLTSDLTGGASSFVLIDGPDVATVSQAAKTLLQDHWKSKSSQPAQMTYLMTEAFTLDQAMLALQAQAGWMTGSVEASFRRQIDEHKHSLMVRFSQVYYTLSAVPPARPSDWVADESAARDVLDDGGKPVAYVSSVSYGRSLWLLASSNSSLKKLGASLTANSSVVVNSYEVQAALNQLLANESVRVTALVLGGGGSGAVRLLSSELKTNVVDMKPTTVATPPAEARPGAVDKPGEQRADVAAPQKPKAPPLDVSINRVVTIDRTEFREALRGFLESGAECTAENPGVPLSYTLGYLGSNRIARLSDARTYKAPRSRKVVALVLDYTVHGGQKDGQWHAHQRDEIDLQNKKALEKGVDLIATIKKGSDVLARQGLEPADIYTAWIPLVPAPAQRIDFKVPLDEADLDLCSVQIRHVAASPAHTTIITTFKLQVTAVYAPGDGAVAAAVVAHLAA